MGAGQTSYLDVLEVQHTKENEGRWGGGGRETGRLVTEKPRTLEAE